MAPAALPPVLAAEAPDTEPEDVTVMAPFTVNAAPPEDFGFRIIRAGSLTLPYPAVPVFEVIISRVFPNTAAARAGLRPGDHILRTDGKTANFSMFSLSKWRKLQEKKASEAASDKTATWTLEVQSPGSKTSHTVTLTVPSPGPHWGAMPWQPPQDREAAIVPEPGPLAQLARQVLANGIWTWQSRTPLAEQNRARPDWRPGAGSTLGYDWTLTTRDGTNHTIFVTRGRGRTVIILERSDGQGYHTTFFTDPSGALQETQVEQKNLTSLPLKQERTEFEKEVAFWLKDVGRVTGRWPFEVSNPELTALSATGRAKAESLATVGLPVEGPVKAAQNLAKPPDSFLKLGKATDAQRAMFAEALGKLGADEDRWAYTETSRGLDDKHVSVVRFDPSKTGDERATLLKIDGKPPTPAAVAKWRDEGRDAPATLSELPPIRDLIDLDDVRVYAEETAAVVFELPLRSDNKEFPADKFQALFRVNKTTRGFEDFSVKLRESFRVAGVVKVTDAGMEARFQSLDPAQAPQPVLFKAGGAVRVLLVRYGRSFEATREDFKPVEPAP